MANQFADAQDYGYPVSMDHLINWLQFSGQNQLLALLLAAFIMGAAKSGLKGLTMLAVPLLALNFGTKASTGLMVPILIFADLFAVAYYRRDANWSCIWRLFPAAVLGVLIAVFVGDSIDEEVFRIVVAVAILLSVLLIIYLERYPLNPKALEKKSIAFAVGLIGGFTTMIGNIGGPIMTVFLLSIRMPKNEFIGTGAYFFLLINIVKLPFHLFVWETVNMRSVAQDVFVLPAIGLGFFLGLLIVRRIPEKVFRYMVIGVTLLASLKLLFT